MTRPPAELSDAECDAIHAQSLAPGLASVFSARRLIRAGYALALAVPQREPVAWRSTSVADPERAALFTDHKAYADAWAAMRDDDGQALLIVTPLYAAQPAAPAGDTETLANAIVDAVAAARDPDFDCPRNLGCPNAQCCLDGDCWPSAPAEPDALVAHALNVANDMHLPLLANVIESLQAQLAAREREIERQAERIADLELLEIENGSEIVTAERRAERAEATAAAARACIEAADAMRNAYLTVTHGVHPYVVSVYDTARAALRALERKP